MEPAAKGDPTPQPMREKISTDPDFDNLWQNTHAYLEKTAAVKKATEAPGAPIDPTPKGRSRFSWKTRAALFTGAALMLGGTWTNSGVGNNQFGSSPESTPTTAPAEMLTPEGNINLTYEVLKPFVKEAFQRRAERAKNDPEYSHRVDRELNENRINLVVFGYSEEHDQKYEDYGGAPSILSYDLKTGQIGQVHLSRDIRVPELERLFPNDPIDSQRVRSLYKKLGFSGMGKVIEEITGLSADFQILLKDMALNDAIEQLADGSLTLNVAKEHDTGPYRLGGMQFRNSFIKKGIQEMTTAEAMRYVLAEDRNPMGKEDERSYRKNEVLDALTKKIKERAKQNPLVVISILNFLKNEASLKNVEADFDLGLFNNGWQLLGGFAGAIGKALASGTLEAPVPEMNRSQEHVFHDPYFGDGGVTRVHSIRDVPNPQRDKPEVLADVKQKDKLPDWMLIPDGGNPYAKDLVTDYWQSMRGIIKKNLTTQ